MTDILCIVEPPSFSESEALREVIASAAARLGLENPWEIHLAVMLAPIGNVTVPPETLVRSRAGQPLTEAEEQMLAHLPETAARLLVNIPRLQGVAKIVRYQNKAFDGSGFPLDDVAGDAIPVGARLLKIILDLSACQRGGISRAEAFRQLEQRTGQYDAALLKALQRAFEGKRPESGPVKQLSQPVSVGELVPGMILRSNVETKDGTLILQAGHRINDMTREKILNFASVTGVKEPILIERLDI